MILDVTVVNSCTREPRIGGSPTALVHEQSLSDAQHRSVPALAGTSHAVFADEQDGVVSLRFFTSEGELPACGHGTIAALGVRASGALDRDWSVRTKAGVFAARTRWMREYAVAEFDAGPVRVRAAAGAESDPVTAALGLGGGHRCHVASTGRERLLVAADALALRRLAPDFKRLREVCDRAGLLGCFVYAPSAYAPVGRGRLAGRARFEARMFAPSIGVDEDVANANSTAGLAAALAGDGLGAIAVEQGGALGRPSRIYADAQARGDGVAVRLGGDVDLEPLTRRLRLPDC